MNKPTYTHFIANALIEALVSSGDQLEELTIKDLKKDAIGKTRPHKGTKARSKPVASKLVDVTDKGIMKWESTAVTTEGKSHWDQEIVLLDWDEAIGFDDMKYSERANLALSGDVKVKCNCPAMKFWGYHYIATQLDYNSGKPENRKPVVRNPNLESTVCKHLLNAINAAMFNISEVASAMKKSKGESFMVDSTDKYTEKMLGEFEETLYIDYAGGKFEAWFYKEGRRWAASESHDIQDILRYAKKEGFDRIVITKEAQGFFDKSILGGYRGMEFRLGESFMDNNSIEDMISESVQEGRPLSTSNKRINRVSELVYKMTLLDAPVDVLRTLNDYAIEIQSELVLLEKDVNRV